MSNESLVSSFSGTQRPYVVSTNNNNCINDIESKPAAKFGNSSFGLLPLDWALGVPVGVQSAIYHADAVALLTTLMKERNIAIPERHRTVGGNAAIAAKK